MSIRADLTTALIQAAISEDEKGLAEANVGLAKAAVRVAKARLAVRTAAEDFIEALAASRKDPEGFLAECDAAR